jgi:hypothetical protein
MSFLRFIYYCAAWGGAAAYLAWAAALVLSDDGIVLPATVRGLALGVFVGLGLALVDALVVPGGKRPVVIIGRILIALGIGSFGGLFGGLLSGVLLWTAVKLTGTPWRSLQLFGWTFTGFLIGAAPAAYDLIASLARREALGGAGRKVRNGLLGGLAGGLAGGLVSLFLSEAWGGAFKAADVNDLWSPRAAGFVALGALIGLSVALAQVILRESWLRVESGFRPGRQLLLTRPEVTIGRAESCDVGLFGDTRVEKQHARIVRQGNVFLLTDLGTASGTFVNGQRITGPTPLNSGDKIQVGGSVLAFGTRARQTTPLASGVA